MVLHKLYKISHDVYDVMSSPDIDVNEFIQVIMASLDDVKKHIPRCGEAFDLIASSVNLLQNNFDDYYKDYVASNNPTIIMENFVLDVSQKAKSSPRIAAQFRRIITHYRKLAAQQASNPKLQSLFQQVDKNFQELEKKVRGGAKTMRAVTRAPKVSNHLRTRFLRQGLCRWSPGAYTAWPTPPSAD
jgi:hypothetical protein